MDSIWPFKTSLSINFLARYAWDVAAGEFAAQLDGASPCQRRTDL